MRFVCEPMLDGNVLWLGSDGSETVLPPASEPPRSAEVIVCFDGRTCDVVGAHEVRLQHAWVGDLESLVTAKLGTEESSKLRELKSRIVAHMAACRVVGLSDLPLHQQVPPALLLSYHGARARAISRLFDVPGVFGHKRLNELHRLARVFARMETSGIHVDISRLGKDPWSMRYERYLVGNYLHPRYTPFGTSTGRFGVEPNSFNPMGIPHGGARKPITSRFPNGKIVVFDYNAMDVRSLMNVLDIASDEPDIHEQTSRILDCTRQEAKAYTYVEIYGGSNLPPDPAKAELLTKRFAGARDFRKRLRDLASSNKPFVKGDLVVDLDANWHDGKLVAIVVQSASSRIFERNLVEMERKIGTLRSRLIFTVHDEMVFDVHPEEIVQMKEVVLHCVEDCDDGTVPYRLGTKLGENYGELE